MGNSKRGESRALFSSIYIHLLLQHGFIIYWKGCAFVSVYLNSLYLWALLELITDRLIFPISGILVQFCNKIPRVGHHIFFRFWVSKAASPSRTHSVLSLVYLQSLCCCEIPSGKMPFNLSRKRWCFRESFVTGPCRLPHRSLMCPSASWQLPGAQGWSSRWVYNPAVLLQFGDYSINPSSCSELIQSKVFVW